MGWNTCECKKLNIIRDSIMHFLSLEEDSGALPSNKEIPGGTH